MLVTMTSNQETKGMICGGCGHAWNSHKIVVDTEKTKLDAKCRFCDCKEISEG